MHILSARVGLPPHAAQSFSFLTRGGGGGDGGDTASCLERGRRWWSRWWLWWCHVTCDSRLRVMEGGGCGHVTTDSRWRARDSGGLPSSLTRVGERGRMVVAWWCHW